MTGAHDGEFEIDLRRLEQDLHTLEFQMALLRDLAGQTLQNVIVSTREAGQNVCTTTITGNVIGNPTLATALAGATLHIVGHTSGTDYGTYTLAAGTFSIGLSLMSSDTSLNFYATGPGVRFATSSAQTRSVTHCTTNALANIVTVPASGYDWTTISSGCQFPIKTTLSYTDSMHGSGTLTGAFGVGLWTGSCVAIPSSAEGGCTATAQTPVFFGMRSNMRASIFYAANNFTNCPVSSGCPNTVPGSSNLEKQYLPAAITSQQCPDAGSTLFDVTWAVSDVRWHGGTSQTIRIYEV